MSLYRSFNYRDHAFLNEILETHDWTQPNKWDAIFEMRTVVHKDTRPTMKGLFYLVPFTHNPNKARFALCSLLCTTVVNFNDAKET